MEAEQLPRQLMFSRLSAGCRRRQAHRVRPASMQTALRLREFVRLAESARRCGETTEHGAPSVVEALLSDSFAEYARPRVELAERVWRLHAVLRLFLRLVFVFIFIFWCNLMCFVHIYLAERLKSQCLDQSLGNVVFVCRFSLTYF
jgi:hypothetical protein